MSQTANQSQQEPVGRELRPYALARGEFEVPPDFDDPLPEAILSEFEGTSDLTFDDGDTRQALKEPGYGLEDQGAEDRFPQEDIYT